MKIFTKSSHLVETELELIISMEWDPSFQLLLEKHFRIQPELTFQENTQVLSGRIRAGTACSQLWGSR